MKTSAGECRVAITRCIIQGNGQAQTAATDMLDDLSPRYVFVVGIAGGVPTTDFTLGDVIVSNYVHDLTLEDTGVGSPRFNAKGGPLHAEAARVVARLPALGKSIASWSSTVSATRPSLDGTHTTNDEKWNGSIDAAFKHHKQGARVRPVARAETIGSSDRLVKDPELIAAWRTVIKGIVAVEMEAAGVYAVCQPRHVPCLAVRGISDIIGWQRDEQWTLYACDTAAAFTRGLVGSGVFQRPANAGQKRPKAGGSGAPACDLLWNHVMIVRSHETRGYTIVIPIAFVNPGVSLSTVEWAAIRLRTKNGEWVYEARSIADEADLNRCNMVRGAPARTLSFTPFAVRGGETVRHLIAFVWRDEADQGRTEPPFVETEMTLCVQFAGAASAVACPPEVLQLSDKDRKVVENHLRVDVRRLQPDPI